MKGLRARLMGSMGHAGRSCVPAMRRAPLLLGIGAVAVFAFAVEARPSAGEERTVLPPAPATTSALPALLDRVLTPPQKAERAFLEHLGWRFAYDANASAITVAGGAPSRRPDLASAQAAGDLRILVPPGVRAEDVVRFGDALSAVADSLASRCAWQFRVAPAVDRAIARLAANEARGFWTFPQWALWNSPVFSMDPPPSQWVRLGRICRARTRPSAAIEAFYGEHASTECFVAQTVASYAIQYEIYGPTWFDQAFAPDEIAIGQVEDYHETPLGRSMLAPEGYPWRALVLRPSDAAEDAGAVLGRLGPLAFPGLTGILSDQNGSGRSNQNFTFVSVSSAAADGLATSGGFAFVASCTQELLTLLKSSRAPFVVGEDLQAIQVRVDRILGNPVMRGIRLFIHPFGVVTLGEFVDRARRSERVALEVVLYDEAREDTFFRRYREAWKTRWSRSTASR